MRGFVFSSFFAFFSVFFAIGLPPLDIQLDHRNLILCKSSSNLGFKWRGAKVLD
jgi:hypothetical protein